MLQTQPQSLPFLFPDVHKGLGHTWSLTGSPQEVPVFIEMHRPESDTKPLLLNHTKVHDKLH